METDDLGEAAGAAFMEALAEGASPEAAFTAAAAAATQAADGLGISPEISGPVIEAAQGAFVGKPLEPPGARTPSEDCGPRCPSRRWRVSFSETRSRGWNI